MLTIALTGGIGSGKSTVADRFVARGAALVDTDRIAHELTAPGGAAIDPIRAAFGDGVIGADGSMDRAAMRGLVFSDPAARRRLEAILHPMIRARTEAGVAAAARAGAPYAIIAIPLLVESGDPRGRADRVLVVDCPEDVQVARVMRRSGLERAQVDAIMAAQATRAARLAAADDVIDNAGEPAALDAQVERLHRAWLALAGAGTSGLS
ncbi:MAG: dephospho-CoA kinase [Lautropia sp.]